MTVFIILLEQFQQLRDILFPKCYLILVDYQAGDAHNVVFFL